MGQSRKKSHSTQGRIRNGDAKHGGTAADRTPSNPLVHQFPFFILTNTRYFWTIYIFKYFSKGFFEISLRGMKWLIHFLNYEFTACINTIFIFINNHQLNLFDPQLPSIRVSMKYSTVISQSRIADKIIVVMKLNRNTCFKNTLSSLDSGLFYFI